MRITQTTRRLIAGCSLALLVAAGGSAAFAHGGGGGGGHSGGDHNGGDHVSNGGDHVGDGGHGRCIDCGGGNDVGGRNIDGNYWRHHHHHHIGGGPGGLGPVHGPGSSHNPIVYHPPVKPIRPPVAVAGPAKLPKPPNQTFCQFQESGGVLRDHRSNSNISGPCPRHLPPHH
jgi:hypothetical protein